ncbi:hypothetical protein [Chryseobacterium sp. JM1]|uniref:hypothetical protein n=1 Tax=Chryseobacterium sp. JM1 TaxID=1233950 RepID=UPI0004E73502|nr:hypothetical protein [Chryseobacterium sp. JM1]KFF22680.1 hypothetical protein IW22_00010 [Chryseobacterium sp. JM1]
MKIIATLILTVLFISCHKKETFDKPKDTDTIVTMNQITTNYDTLIKRVKCKGDIDAYDEMFFSFMDSNEAERTDSLMIYSKIMAEKYHNKKAYLDYFVALCEKYNVHVDYSNYSTINLSKMESFSKKQAEDWLKKMLEKKVITQEQYNSVQR